MIDQITLKLLQLRNYHFLPANLAINCLKYHKKQTNGEFKSKESKFQKCI